MKTYVTPPEYAELARQVMGSIDDRRVFATLVGPTTPSRMMDTIEQYGSGEIDAAVLLTYNAADTKWAQAAGAAGALVCLKIGRIRFLDEHGVRQGSPGFGQMFFYFGKDGRRFVDVFSTIGNVLEVVRVNSRIERELAS